jgi:hypothetical protein
MLIILKKLNLYFFGEEEIGLSDAIWFYGMYAVTGIIALTVVLPIWISNKF